MEKEGEMRKKSAILNILTSIFFQLVTLVCGLIVPRLIIGAYGSEVNGFANTITQFLAFITLLQAGVGPVVKSMLYRDIAKKDQNRINGIMKSAELFFRGIGLISVGYIIVICIFLPNTVGDKFDIFFSVTLIIAVSISTIAEYLFGITYMIFLQAVQKSYIVHLLSTFTKLASTIVVIIMVHFDCSIVLVKAISSLIFIIKPIMQYLYVRRRYNVETGSNIERIKIKQKWDGLAQHVAYTIHQNTDVIVLSLFSTLSNVSIYGVYNMITTEIKSLITAFSGGLEAGFGDIIAKKERKKLLSSFSKYESFYMTLVSIIYPCTLLLITPFVSVYTIGVTDANYIQGEFGVLITIAAMVYAIRQPYNSIVLAAGHFKQTKRGAIVEALVNIVLSVILVWKFGLVGVAIGTLVAMLIRSIEFIYHTNKHILRRSIFESVKKIFIVVIDTILIALIVHFIPMLEMNSYLHWIMYAIEVFAVALVVVLPFNYLLYKDDFRDLKRMMKMVARRKQD